MRLNHNKQMRNEFTEMSIKGDIAEDVHINFILLVMGSVNGGHFGKLDVGSGWRE